MLDVLTGKRGGEGEERQLTAEDGGPIVGGVPLALVIYHGLPPYVPVPLAARLGSRFFEPRMLRWLVSYYARSGRRGKLRSHNTYLIGSVVDYQIHDELHVPAVQFGDELLHVLQFPVGWMDSTVVGNIVAHIDLR